MIRQGMVALVLAGMAASASAMLTDAAAEAAARSALSKLTLEEKARLIANSGTMTLAALPSLGITNEWTFSDNSSTVRSSMERWGWDYTEPVSVNTKLPSLLALAQTWDVDWARRHGEVLGAECRDRGVDQVLGPGVNLMRTPLCGRNWEYLGEDPCLAARMCVPMIEGVQSYDVAATVKHFILNNQELGRHDVDTHVSRRAFNELYLPAFKAAVQEAGVLSVMSSYNKIDGIWASENKYTQQGVLRERLGFRGMLVSDWGGQHSGEFALVNGTGVEASCGGGVVHLCHPASNRWPIAEAVRAGRVPAAVLDEAALRTLYVMAKTGFLTGDKRRPGARNTREHQRVAREEGADSVVLLRNDAELLPLKAGELKKVLVIGMEADTRQCSRGCSAEGFVPYEVTLYAALTNRLEGAEVKLMPLCRSAIPVPEIDALAAWRNANEARRAGGHAIKADPRLRCEPAELRAAAEAADVVILFTGTMLGYEGWMETEAHDRDAMEQPADQQLSINMILDWQLPRLVVVSRSGSPVGYDWIDRVGTFVQSGYLGMEEGNSICDVLFGEVNPSGRLAQSWPRRYADTAVAQCGSYNATNVCYHEGCYMGYRWHDFKGIKPAFPFGAGLSYTTFGYRVEPAEGLAVKVTVTNTGKRFGKEVVQVYAAYPSSPVERCVKELKAFRKLALGPGESQTVTIALSERDLAYYDEFASCFRTLAGEYELLVGSTSEDIRGRVKVSVPVERTFAD